MTTDKQIENKPWYESKAVVGGVVAVVAGIAGIMGVAINPDDQEAIVATVTAVGSAVGGALAVYGRIKASQPIGKK